MKILATGLHGLVGSRVTELLKDTYTFENISRSSGVDITNREQVLNAIENSAAEIILHLAAKTAVDACEEDKKEGKNGEAWKINVDGTRNVVNAVKKTNKKIIYISTDFVFDGEQETYSENDKTHALNWYGETKLQGENIVQEQAGKWLIIRPAYPYRASFERLDFMRAIKKRLMENQPVMGVTDHYFTPTYIDDFAHVLNGLITQNATGTYHVVGETTLTPYAAALEIANTFGLSSDQISQTTRAEYFANKATRPFCLALKNDKINALGMQMRTFAEGLEEIKGL